MQDIPRNDLHAERLVGSPRIETSTARCVELKLGSAGLSRKAREKEVKLRTLPLADSDIDRSDALRAQPERLAELWLTAKIIAFDGEKFELESASDRPQLKLHSPSVISNATVDAALFLGIDSNNPTDVFFLARVDQVTHGATLREMGAQLSPRDIALAAHAQGLVNWHARHTHCPLCGAKTHPALGGSIRRCEADGSDHYPRTDPAIITLVRDSEDRILLGRQSVWPEHRFSTFAGFVETGESFEQCIRRELFEEAGVEVNEISYLGSQPWPFPASLMVAFQARITNPTAARADGVEIEEIRWFTRDSLKEAIDAGTLLLPPLISVARAMIEGWYHEGEENKNRPALPGSETWRP